jgi:23S rRNA pseudouridine2604 synthase
MRWFALAAPQPPPARLAVRALLCQHSRWKSAGKYMRLNKYISDTGLCSRREADELIEAGRVVVDGVKAQVGGVIEAGAEVLVDGNRLRLKNERGGAKSVYIALNKPVGITCTTETDVKDNVIDFVDHKERIFPIGRLDKDSEGLILLTNNGDIVNEILRAENRHEKEYLVAVNKPITDEFLLGMARGVRIHGQMTKPCKVYKLGKFGFRIILTQGLNRQIRLMATAFGYRVKQLCRVRIVNIKLGNLKLGQWRNLTPAELKGLLPNRTQW